MANVSYTIGKAIYDILVNDSTILGLVDEKIFPVVAPEDREYPFIVYRTVSQVPLNIKEENYSATTSPLDEVRVQIMCFGKFYPANTALAQAVRDALDRNSGVFSDVAVRNFTFDNCDEDIVERAGYDGIFVHTSDYFASIYNEDI